MTTRLTGTVLVTRKHPRWEVRFFLTENTTDGTYGCALAGTPHIRKHITGFKTQAEALEKLTEMVADYRDLQYESNVVGYLVGCADRGAKPDFPSELLQRLRMDR